MICLVVGGVVEKQKIAAKITEIGGENVSVAVKSDIEAAMMVKAGQAEYYLGACATGGGGALAMALAILTRQKCATVSMPGRLPQASEIKQYLTEGKVAFGFTGDHVDLAVPLIMKAILEKEQK
ncbi:MAG TPA: DUF2620 domain-containing protein [Firmicutes bacterium]|nr:DUF2620 domain-containing protein [Bacillota bacterium]